MKKYMFSGVFVVLASIFAVGCASLTPISRETQAELILAQIEATLETADILYADLSKEGVSPESLRITRTVFRAMKPQVVSWISLIETLKASDDQYNTAQDLKVDLEAVVVKIDAL